MAITTLAGVAAGQRPPVEFLFEAPGTTVGMLGSLQYAVGRPGKSVTPTPGMAGEALTSGGRFGFQNPTSGNSYLTRFAAAATGGGPTVGSVWLVDRLWQNSGIVVTTTTAQTINSVAWPARDRNGSTNGDGVIVALEIRTTTGAAAAQTSTLEYTNQAGTSGRVGSFNTAFYVPASGVGGFIPFSLQTGDTGVRSVQSITLNTSLISGNVHLVAYRLLAMVHLKRNGLLANDDALHCGMVRLYDNTVPMLLYNGTATNIHGYFAYSQG